MTGQFELPSKLPLQEHMTNLEVFIGDAEHFELADDSTVDITEAYNAFTAMVEEIGRLKDELANVAAANLQHQAENSGLRALNAELLEFAKGALEHPDNPLITMHLKALIAKSEES